MSVLAPFLKIGVTFALFHEMGTVLVTKLRLKIFSKPLMIAGPAKEIIVLDIPSGPAALLLLIFLRLLRIFLESRTKELQEGAETL